MITKLFFWVSCICDKKHFRFIWDFFIVPTFFLQDFLLSSALWRTERVWVFTTTVLFQIFFHRDFYAIFIQAVKQTIISLLANLSNNSKLFFSLSHQSRCLASETSVRSYIIVFFGPVKLLYLFILIVEVIMKQVKKS